MTKFLFKISLFFAILYFADLGAGYLLSYMLHNAKGGDTGRHNYISSVSKDDILILGSSRALRHYDCKIIGDSLGLSCLNCGESGNGIIYNYGQLTLIGQRHKPRAIIYDFYPPFDLLKNDNHKYLRWLKPYYDRKGIAEIFASVDSKEKYKMSSNFYRYNSLIFNVFLDYFHPVKSSGTNGYVPLKGVGKPILKNDRIMELDYSGDEDTLKLHYFYKLIEETKAMKSNLIIVISPSWYNVNEKSLKIIKSICNNNKIPLFDFSNSKKYTHNDKYYYDGNHLNELGATEFSKDLHSLILPILKHQ